MTWWVQTAMREAIDRHFARQLFGFRKPSGEDAAHGEARSNDPCEGKRPAGQSTAGKARSGDSSASPVAPAHRTRRARKRKPADRDERPAARFLFGHPQADARDEEE